MARTARPRMAGRGWRMPRRWRGSGMSARTSRRERGADTAKPPASVWASPLYQCSEFLPRSTIERPWGVWCGGKAGLDSRPPKADNHGNGTPGVMTRWPAPVEADRTPRLAGAGGPGRSTTMPHEPNRDSVLIDEWIKTHWTKPCPFCGAVGKWGAWGPCGLLPALGPATSEEDKEKRRLEFPT